MCENVKINVVNLYPDDVIIAHLNENIGPDEVHEIY